MSLKKDDWALVAIAEAGNRGLTPAQLQKSLFLLNKSYEEQLDEFYDFKPYNYGPFDKNIYVDADKLGDEGLVESRTRDGQNWSMYHITPQGQQKVGQLSAEADEAQLNYLRKIVRWSQGLSFQELIASIYRRYPEYKVNSVFRD